MPENTAYFEAITAERALLVDPEEALRADCLISIETQAEFEGQTEEVFVRENFPLFQRYIANLSAQDQDLLLSYFVLHRSQTALGYIFRITQTEVSSTIRLAMKRLCFVILFDKPQAHKLRTILERHNLEHPQWKAAKKSKPQVPLSEVIEHFDQTRNFHKTADRYGINRPEVRKHISRAAKTLLQSSQSQAQALGAYLYQFVHRFNSKPQPLRHKDPD
jgi:hypothetical protein